MSAAIADLVHAYGQACWLRDDARATAARDEILAAVKLLEDDSNEAQQCIERHGFGRAKQQIASLEAVCAGQAQVIAAYRDSPSEQRVDALVSDAYARGLRDAAERQP